MASINDAPVNQRWLARRIPSEVLEHLSKRELEARLDAAEDKLRAVPLADNDYERSALKRDAEKILSAMSLRAFIVAAKSLTDAMTDARQRQAGREDYELTKAFDRLYRENPIPYMANPDVLAELSATGQATEPKPRRLSRFWRKND